jgi:cysteine desulfurase
MPARNYSVKEAPVTSDGLLDLASFEQLIDDRTALVSIMYANNEVGSMQSLKKISDLLIKLRKIRSLNGNHLPLYFHSDGCQAGNYLDLHVHKSGVDLMTLNGGKIYGPKQSGVLYVNAGVRFKPQILGGGQERGWRSGTENIAGIVGFAKALDIAQAARQDETRRLQDLQQAFFKLLARHVPEAVINGSLKHRLPNNVHITIPGQDNERLVMAMDEAGIQCAAGSACSAGSEEPSHVLKAMGFTDDAARNSLRFTMGRYTGEKELQYTVETLAKIIA